MFAFDTFYTVICDGFVSKNVSLFESAERVLSFPQLLYLIILS
uniref:Uncharacterized protein n=1 Tax=Anguilla anguilla TaxID=7936 RepID=A0A0E9VHA3_ANGAN